jgi:hypothetical protein
MIRETTSAIDSISIASFWPVAGNLSAPMVFQHAFDVCLVPSARQPAFDDPFPELQCIVTLAHGLGYFEP